MRGENFSSSWRQIVWFPFGWERLVGPKRDVACILEAKEDVVHENYREIVPIHLDFRTAKTANQNLIAYADAGRVGRGESEAVRNGYHFAAHRLVFEGIRRYHCPFNFRYAP